MSFHQTIIIGNVGRDPELRYLQSGTPVCDFSVAVNEYWNDRETNERREKTTWYKVTAWRQLAETCNQYIQKGRQVMVVGTASVSAYTDKSGQPAATLELTARDVRFLGGRGEREGETDYAAPEDVTDIPF